MYLFGMSGTTIELDALKLLNKSKKGFQLGMCMSAYSYLTESHPQKKHSILRYYADVFMIDSGFKSLLRGNVQREEYLDWINNQDRLVDIAETVNADVVVMADVPPDSFPGLGRDIDWHCQQLNLSIAQDLSDIDTDLTKMYVLQGFTPEHYLQLLQLYEDFINPEDWIAFGKPMKGYKRKWILEAITRLRSKIDNHFHILGVTSEKFCRRYIDIGVDSIDGTVGIRQTSRMKNTTKEEKVDRYLQTLLTFGKIGNIA